MVVNVSVVKEFCERMGVGMFDCKKVLEEVNGDVIKVVELLCEKGFFVVVSKVGCVVIEGVVEFYIYVGGCIGVLVEVNCEIDFVGKMD